MWTLKFFLLMILLIISEFGYAKENVELLKNKEIPVKVENYDKKEISKKLRKLKRMKKKHNKIISNIIYKAAKKHDVNPEIIMAIIKVESNFEQSASNKNGCKYVNHKKYCGDYSIAQINYLVWEKEFKREKIKFNLHKLRSSNAYAINKMAEILKILKRRYAKKDPLWFLRYNSGNLLKKLRYLRLIENPLRRIKYPMNYTAKENLLRKAVKRHGWKKVVAIFTKVPSATLKI